jgi:hypothetical protein
VSERAGAAGNVRDFATIGAVIVGAALLLTVVMACVLSIIVSVFVLLWIWSPWAFWIGLVVAILGLAWPWD